MASAAPASASIARLAADRRVHQAFQWLHLQEQRILQWQAEMVGVPAPPFGEGARAEWLCDALSRAGARECRTSMKWAMQSGDAARERFAGCDARLLSAHIDTVFPAGTPIEPDLQGIAAVRSRRVRQRRGRGSDAGDGGCDAPGGPETECDVAFVGNVGEEGEGDLRGMRHIYRDASGGARADRGAHCAGWRGT